MNRIVLLIAVFGIALSAALPAHAQGHVTATVDDYICYTLAAIDAQGDTIRDWDQTGTPITLTLMNSAANIDTSTQTWNDDPDGYTYAIITDGDQPLLFLPPDLWSVPPGIFYNGVATICFKSTKADTGVYIDITPVNTPVRGNLDTMTFVPGPTDHLLVDITWPKEGRHAVYSYRGYEIIVAPQDHFGNITDDSFRIKGSAEFPGEFVHTEPQFAEITDGTFMLHGLYDFKLGSTQERLASQDELQRFYFWKTDDSTIQGASSWYEVLPHAPGVFNLLTPPDSTAIELHSWSVPATFTWEPSNDPYDSIQVSRFDPTLTSDVVTYIVTFYDSTNLVNKVEIDSDNLGLRPMLSLTHGVLNGIAQQLEGGLVSFPKPLYWTVEATDELYTSYNGSDPSKQSEIRTITLKLPVIEDPPLPPPQTFALYEIFPNPFSGSTLLRYDVYSNQPMSIVVYDLLGKKVATIYNGHPDMQERAVIFEGHNLAAGVYQVVLQQGENVASKIVMKVR